MIVNEVIKCFNTENFTELNQAFSHPESTALVRVKVHEQAPKRNKDLKVMTTPLESRNVYHMKLYSEGTCDLQLVAFITDARNKVLADDFFVFEGNTTSPDGSVTLQEDSLIIAPERMTERARRVSVIAIIRRRKGVTPTIVSPSVFISGEELPLGKIDPMSKSISLCVITRKKCHFENIPLNRTLRGLCKHYGVEVED